MNYESSKRLTNVRFKRLVGVERPTFELMLEVLHKEYTFLHGHGGRRPKLSLEDLLLATLQYLREYRTYEQIALDYEIHESNLIRRSHWVEKMLVENGFTIEKGKVAPNDTAIVDATEIRVNRPKKNKG